MLATAVQSVSAPAGPRHGLSTFGDLKYGADFKHFDYVNPDAPKGGKVSQIGESGVTTFDSFNGFIVKGDAAQGLELVYDTLMVRAEDEPDAVYGLVAHSAEVAPDRMSVTFHLRPEAKFADGTPLTAEDVVHSFSLLKEKGAPQFRLSLRDVEKAEAIGASSVRYTFKGELVRDLPLEVATLPIFSKAFYTANDFEKTTLDKPLGSGPYRVGNFKAGTFVEYERRADYWGRDLPVNRGKYNFDVVRYDFFRDRQTELLNLKSGEIDFREEFTSRDWATAYDIDAVKAGRLVRTTIADERPSGAQGFFINTRRAKFGDKRVREALGLAFDFEWSNRNLFFGLYTRTTSLFENSDMKASGPPSPAELALLEPFGDKLAPEVFGAPYLPPVTDGSGNNRDNLKRARDLLSAAGWTAQGGSLRNAKGEPLTVEVLLDEEAFTRVVGPFVKNLKSIGVDASIRVVDQAQYQRRMKSFDFDLVVQRYSLQLTPGPEIKAYWGAEAAKTDGSFNLAGIADPVVDALNEKIMAARSREELVTATRALDRVLRAGHYWVPHWYKAAHNLVYWDKLGFPATKPKYDRGALETWWYDAAKADKLAKR